MTPLQMLSYRKAIKLLSASNPKAKYFWIFRHTPDEYVIPYSANRPKWGSIKGHLGTFNWYMTSRDADKVSEPMLYITGPFSDNDLKDSLVEL